MATTVTKVLLSSSNNGTGTKVVRTVTPGTLIHTATNGDYNAMDEVVLYAVNTSAAAVTLTIEFAGAVVPDNLIIVAIPGYSGQVTVVNRLLITAGLTIAARCSAANVVQIYGYVHRLSTI